jgi:hypothetical protein
LLSKEDFVEIIRHLVGCTRRDDIDHSATAALVGR